MDKKLKKVSFIFLFSIVVNSLSGIEIPYKKGTNKDILFKEFKNIQHIKDDKYSVLFNKTNLEQIVFWVDNEVGLYYVKEISKYYNKEEIYSEFQKKKENLQSTYGSPNKEGDKSIFWTIQNNGIEYIWIFIQEYDGKKFKIMMEVQFNNKELLP